MIGVGGGSPTEKNDIRLGDVVSSKLDRASKGMNQYDVRKQFKKVDSCGVRIAQSSRTLAG